MPQIISVSRAKGLYAVTRASDPNARQVPVLGGIGITFASFLAIFLWMPRDALYGFQYVFVGTLILFLTGIKDDLSPVSAWKKIPIQFLAAAVLIFPGEIHLEGLYGFLGINGGIGEIPEILLSFVVIIGLVNAMNFIDGIDGLLGSLSIVALLFFGGWFYLQGNLLGLIAFTIAGALFGFMLFNYAPARIFMGDSGSLFIGANIAILLIGFLNSNAALPAGHPFKFHASPAIVLGVLGLPIADFLRVCGLRILKGRSPMQSDRRHIHYMLIDSGMTHQVAMVVLTLIQIAFLILALVLDRFIELHTLLFLLVCLIGTGYLILIQKFSGRNIVKQQLAKDQQISFPTVYMENAKQQF